MTELKGKTLAELNVQPGDVVEVKGGCYVIGDNPHGTPGEVKTVNGFLYATHIAKLIHRANPTRAQLDAQIAELTAQRDAMPEWVRVWWDGPYYRDFPLIDGVPEGFVEVTK